MGSTERRYCLRHRRAQGALPPGSDRCSGCGATRLLDQPFGPHRLLDLGPRAEARDKVLYPGPLVDVDLVNVGPIEHGKEVGVGNGELVAHDVLLALEHRIQWVQTLFNYG